MTPGVRAAGGGFVPTPGGSWLAGGRGVPLATLVTMGRHSAVSWEGGGRQGGLACPTPQRAPPVLGYHKEGL